MSRINTLIIPAAGIGSRLYPLTYTISKEMVRLVDKPIFYYLVQEAYIAGIRHIIFVIHSGRRTLKDYLKGHGIKNIREEFPGIRFSFVQTPDRFGDGHAILQAKRYIRKEESFAVTMGDLLAMPGASLIKELTIAYKKCSAPVISVQRVPREMTFQYGVIDPYKGVAQLCRVRSIVEKPSPAKAPSTLIMTGKYILTTEIFTYLEKLMKNKRDTEVKLAHALSDYAQDHPLYAYECKNLCYDTGTKIDLLKTELAFALVHPEYGVRMRRFMKTLNK